MTKPEFAHLGVGVHHEHGAGSEANDEAWTLVFSCPRHELSGWVVLDKKSMSYEGESREMEGSGDLGVVGGSQEEEKG